MQVYFLPRDFHVIEQADQYNIRSIYQTGDQKGVDGSLTSIKEINLGSNSLYTPIMENTNLISFLPLVGEIVITDQITQHFATPGEIHSTIAYSSVINTSHDPVLFLEIAQQAASAELESYGKMGFDIDQVNTLHWIQSKNDVKFELGKFIGRKDYCYSLDDQGSLMAYVISGVFEISHRLTEAGDLLIISNIGQVREIELESLGVESIILLLTLKQ
jgi:hypothetical protein